MPVSAQETVFHYVGNGATVAFPFGCQVLRANDLQVYIDDALVTSGFGVTGIGTTTGGAVTFNSPPPAGAQVRLERIVSLDRTTDYQQNGDFLARVVNPDFNRLWMALQQHAAALGRALVVPKSDRNGPAPLPPAAKRAGKLLSFDDAGDPIAVAPAAQSAVALAVQLASNIGASLAGFTQAGAGAIKQTVQEALRERVSVKQFGAKGDGVTDDYAAIVKARDYCLASAPYKRLVFPAGRYKSSQTISFDYPGLSVRGDGKLNSIIYYTGAGVAVQFTDANPNHNEYAFGGEIKDIGIEGNPNSTTLLLVSYVNHFEAASINLKESSTTLGVGLQVLGSVCGHFKDIVCSTNEQAMASRPQNGIVVSDAIRNGISARATGNKFDHMIIEGMIGDGVQIVNADGCVFVGGTSENNSGNGVTISGRMNTFLGVSFEKGNPKGFADIYDNGFGNRFIGCYSNNLVYVDGGAQFHELTGGYHQSIQVVGDFATVRDLKYSFFEAGGTFLPSGNTSHRNIFNANVGALVFVKKAPVGLTLTGSPFTYTNGSGLDEEVIIRGGTVTQIVFDRDGPVTTLPVSGMFRLAPQDKLIISYDSADPPTVVRVPFGANYL